MKTCTAQHSTAQHSTAQHSTAQHSTAQHSTAQHSTALGIILVVLGHRWPYYLPRSVFCWIYVFHMPLFFFISGMFAPKRNNLEQQNNNWLKKRIRTLVIPYIILGLLFVIANIVFYRLANHVSTVSFRNLIEGLGIGPLWFLPTLFIVEFVYLSIKNICTKERDLFVLVVLSTVLGCTINSFYMPKDPELICYNFPYHINAVLIMLPFYYLGSIFYGKRELLFHFLKKWMLALIVLGAIAISFIASRINHQIDVNYGWYGNYLFFFAGAFSGIIVCIFIAMTIDHHLKTVTPVFSFFGKNTLVLLAFHTLFFMVVAGVFKRAGLDYLNYMPLFNTVFALVCFIPALFFFQKFLPIAVGKAQKRIQ